MQLRHTLIAAVAAATFAAGGTLAASPGSSGGAGSVGSTMGSAGGNTFGSTGGNTFGSTGGNTFGSSGGSTVGNTRTTPGAGITRPMPTPQATGQTGTTGTNTGGLAQDERARQDALAQQAERVRQAERLGTPCPDGRVPATLADGSRTCASNR
jgi:hypothetical protein